MSSSFSHAPIADLKSLQKSIEMSKIDSQARLEEGKENGDAGAETQRTSLFYLAPFIAISTACGLALVVQSGLNANLATSLGHPIRAAFMSFLTGTVVLVPPAFCTGPPLKDSFHKVVSMLREDKWDYLMFAGGPLGAFFVASGVLLSPIIGFALFFVSVVTGQLLTSVLYDKFGFFHTEKQPVGTLQVAGVFAALGGAILFQGDAIAEGSGESFIFAIIGIIAGSLLIIQSSFNKRLTYALGSPWRGALVSFLVGLVALLIATIVETFINDTTTDGLGEGSQFYEYLGGPIGAMVIGAAFIISPTYIGFILTFASVVLGELIGGLILDELDAFGLGRRAATGLRGGGIGTVLIGVGLVTYSSMNRPKSVPVNFKTDVNDNVPV
mmetsp:Transcript_18429/g.27597  ORF Transcript_18429/g.27597 Transcript_18429/m.27597 type:complete len:384 (-) Transcript_18429:159-1310(-)